MLTTTLRRYKLIEAGRAPGWLGYHRPVVLPEHSIETARLTLRPFTPDDFDDLYAYQSRPDVVRYLRWEARDRTQVRQALEDQR
jgi:RimJ/RimL family protein N-acetyltransferase